MKTPAIAAVLSSLVLITQIVGCASGARDARRPGVAILVNGSGGQRPSASEVAEIHTLLQPEIERRGYVIARSLRSAEYSVSVPYPFDSSGLGRLQVEKLQPTVPFLPSEESASERSRRERDRTTAEMLREPK